MSRAGPYLLAVCIGLLIGVSLVRKERMHDPFAPVEVVNWRIWPEPR